jgi:hypothetical protein
VNSLEAALRRIAGELDARGRRWALVGGLAVSARAEPRTTRDVDVVVDVRDDADAESLVLDLQAGGFRVLAVVEQRSLMGRTRSKSSQGCASPSPALVI